MSETQSAAIAVRTTTDLASVDQWIGQLENILISNEPQEIQETDAEAMSSEIVRQLLAAESDEELESFGNAQGWRDLLGVPIKIDGFSWRPSEFEGEGASIYFVVFGNRLDTGAKVVLTTGSRNIMAQLANMAKRRTLGGAVRIAEKADRPTKGGFYPLSLRTPDEAKSKK